MVINDTKQQNFRWVQIESTCRQQNNRNSKIEICFQQDGNIVGKGEKCWLPVFSPFPARFSKGFYVRVVKTRDCLGKV